jgi:Protein of unknown function (DUF3093)
VPAEPDLTYDERLFVPLRWWVFAALLVASLWVAYWVATPHLVAFGVTLASALLAAALLSGYGGAPVSVGRQGFRAGRALLPLDACGEVSALSEPEFHHLRGRGADARAYLLLRPYLSRAVRVDVADPADPVPYWLVATRHPDRLAQALRVAIEQTG